MTILAAPALPLHSAGKYVAGAYIVFVAVVLVYVAIMATRLRRTERELVQLRRDASAEAFSGNACVRIHAPGDWERTPAHGHACIRGPARSSTPPTCSRGTRER